MPVTPPPRPAAARRSNRRPERELTRNDPIEERWPYIRRRLRAAYPDAKVALAFSTPLECLVATILSAQTTDEIVNRVTQGPNGLFAKYRTAEGYLSVSVEELAADLKPTGFFNNKTKAVRGACQKMVDDYGGEVPRTMRELMTLPGVARKTANIVQGNAYPREHARDPDAGIAVDTHVGRLAHRIGFSSQKDPDKVERDLMRVIPRKEWFDFTYVLIDHGRTICQARLPHCEICPIKHLCPASRVP
jgi:endonuclease-3